MFQNMYLQVLAVGHSIENTFHNEQHQAQNSSVVVERVELMNAHL